MADHPVSTATGELGAHAILGANAVDRVLFDADLDAVELLNLDPAADIYYTLDRTDPAGPAYANARRLPAGMASVVTVPTGGATEVRLRSAAAAPFSVQRP